MRLFASFNQENTPYDSSELAASYTEKVAQHYRHCDKKDIETPASVEVAMHLKAISTSFPMPVNVLDVGCGTGRFFHALRNVKQIVGLDISKAMLTAAKSPVRSKLVCTQNIQLVHGDYMCVPLPRSGFHVIYSVGVLGHPAPINLASLERLYDLLAPGGRLFFTIADESDPTYRGQGAKNFLKRHLQSFLARFFPEAGQWLKDRWQVHFISPERMNEMFAESRFESASVKKMVNRFYACEARKPYSK